jgi:dynein intermediate chain
LWNPKLSNQPLARFTNFDDYVTDVKWSPVHPASFAAVDSSGALSVWNMNVEKETPIATNIQAKSALLRLAWSPHIQTRANAGSSSTPSDMFIAATTHHSNVFIYKLDRNVAMPAEDDWAKFDATVKEFVSSRNGADQTSGGLGGLMDSSAFSSAQSLDFSSI